MGGSPATDRTRGISTSEGAGHIAFQEDEPPEEEAAEELLEEAAAEDPWEAELEEVVVTAEVTMVPPTPLTPLRMTAWACRL